MPESIKAFGIVGEKEMSNVHAASVKCPNCGAGVEYSQKENVAHEMISCSYCGTKLKITYERPIKSARPAAPAFDSATIVIRTGRPIIGVEIIKRKLLPLMLGSAFAVAAIGVATSFFLMKTVNRIHNEARGNETSPLSENNSGENICDGDEQLIFNNRNVSSKTGIIASGNCRVVLNNSTINSDSVAITASGNARVIINNSKITGRKIALKARGKASVTALNSVFAGGHTGAIAEDGAQVNLTNSIIRGGTFAYRKSPGARVILINTKPQGDVVK